MELASLLISVVSLILSTLVILAVARNQWREKRHDACLKLWEFWMSHETKKSRNRAYRFLQQQERQDGFIDLVALSNKDPELRNDFSIVFHFFKDLHIMVRRGLVDRSLAKELFLHEVNSWFHYLKPARNSKLSHPKFRLWEHGEQRWGERFVLPLQAELKSCPDKSPWL